MEQIIKKTKSANDVKLWKLCSATMSGTLRLDITCTTASTANANVIEARLVSASFLVISALHLSVRPKRFISKFFIVFSL